MQQIKSIPSHIFQKAKALINNGRVPEFPSSAKGILLAACWAFHFEHLVIHQDS